MCQEVSPIPQHIRAWFSMRPEALREAQGWLQKVQSDLRSIEILMGDSKPPLDSVCFHAQQAVEKTLKALLTVYGTPFPKTHDLARLVHLLPLKVDLCLDEQTLAELTYFAVGSRYPTEFVEYTRDLAKKLWQGARTAYDVASDLVSGDKLITDG